MNVMPSGHSLTDDDHDFGNYFGGLESATSRIDQVWKNILMVVQDHRFKHHGSYVQWCCPPTLIILPILSEFYLHNYTRVIRIGAYACQPKSEHSWFFKSSTEKQERRICSFPTIEWAFCPCVFCENVNFSGPTRQSIYSYSRLWWSRAIWWWYTFIFSFFLLSISFELCSVSFWSLCLLSAIAALYYRSLSHWIVALAVVVEGIGKSSNIWWCMDEINLGASRV